MRIVLTPEEEEWCEGRVEETVARFAHRPDRAGVPFSMDKRRLGVRAEKAASIATGKPMAREVTAKYDLASGPYHVRATRLWDIFALQKREVPHLKPTDYVIVVKPVGSALDVLGWLDVAECHRYGEWRSVNDHPRALWVPITQLHPIHTLPGYEGPRR